MSGYNYSMLGEWRLEPTTTTVLGQKFLRTLEALMQAAPEIGEFRVADLEDLHTARSFSIDEARARIPQFVEAGMIHFDGDPQPHEGYLMHAVNMSPRSPKVVSWTACVGGEFGTRLEFEVGSLMIPSDLDIVTYPLFRAALLTTIAEWPSNWVNSCAYRKQYHEAPTAPGVPAHPYTRFHLPWLSYLSDPLAAGLRPPAEILTERTPDGGLLMIAAEERLDPSNPDHMRRSRIMADIMVERAGTRSV